MVTGLKVMTLADKHKLDAMEFFLIRVTFSIYSGWVTAATIVGTAIMFKSWGMSNDDSKRSANAWTWMEFMMFFDEETWGCVIMFVALAIYNVASWRQLNPMFGCVYIWASGAILK